jgi:hypothetical protein
MRCIAGLVYFADETVSLIWSRVSFLIYIVLPVVLYGCETWSLTLREKRWLRVCDNRVLRRVFGPKGGRGDRGMEKVT